MTTLSESCLITIKEYKVRQGRGTDRVGKCNIMSKDGAVGFSKWGSTYFKESA